MGYCSNPCAREHSEKPIEPPKQNRLPGPIQPTNAEGGTDNSCVYSSQNTLAQIIVLGLTPPGEITAIVFMFFLTR